MGTKAVNWLVAPFVLGALFYSLITEASGDAALTRERIKEEIESAVAKAARKQSLGVDPEVTAEIVADSVIFFSIFCYDHPTECTEVVDDSQTLREVVSAFLEDAKSRPDTIETIASRLGATVGLNMADAGWPSARENNIGVVTIPEILQDAEISMLSATGRQQVGGPAAALIMRPGKLSLVANLEDKPEVYGTIYLESRGIQEWVVSESAKSADISSIGAIEANLENYCQENESAGFKGPLALFNWGRAMIAESESDRSSHLLPAAYQAGLDIRIRDESNACDKACKKGLGIAFAEAIAIWRSGCARCRNEALSVIQIEGSVWMDRRIVDRVRKNTNSPENINLDITKPNSEEVGVFLAAPSVSIPQSLIVGYEQVDDDASIRDTICQLKSKTGDDWVSFSQSFLCPYAEPISEMKLHPELIARDGWTDCEQDAIACAIPGGNVQLATAEYAYNIPLSSGDAMLGNPSKAQKFDIRPIILHEVGHWFGVPHPEAVDVTVADIMAGVFKEGSECVSAESLSMLNNATDDRWAYRAKTNQGLLPPRAVLATPTLSESR